MQSVSQKQIDEQTATLAAAARRLNSLSGARAPFSLAFLTDRKRIADPDAIAMALPPGAAFIYRDYDDPDRITRTRALQRICAERGVYFLIGRDAALAREINADGVHLQSDQLSWPRPDIDVVSASCHSKEELERAYALGADIALLGPVFPTASHPGAPSLGADLFKTLTKAAAIPVLALGGVNKKNAFALAGPNVAGFAAISAFTPAKR